MHADNVAKFLVLTLITKRQKLVTRVVNKYMCIFVGEYRTCDVYSFFILYLFDACWI